MQSHSVYWRCQCVTAEILAIVLRTPLYSAYMFGCCLIAVRRLLRRDGNLDRSNVRGVNGDAREIRNNFYDLSQIAMATS